MLEDGWVSVGWVREGDEGEAEACWGSVWGWECSVVALDTQKIW